MGQLHRGTLIAMDRNESFRKARSAVGMTQEQLERAANVSQCLISELERGKCPRSVVLALRLARTLNTSVEELFGQYVDSAVGQEAHEERPRARRRGRVSSAEGRGSQAA